MAARKKVRVVWFLHSWSQTPTPPLFPWISLTQSTIVECNLLPLRREIKAEVSKFSLHVIVAIKKRDSTVRERRPKTRFNQTSMSSLLSSAEVTKISEGSGDISTAVKQKTKQLENSVRKKGTKQKENTQKRKRSKINNTAKDAVSILLEDTQQESLPGKNAATVQKKHKPSEKKNATKQTVSKEESKTVGKDMVVAIKNLLRDLEVLKKKGKTEIETQDTAFIPQMNKLHILLTDLLFTQYFSKFPEEKTVHVKDLRLWKARRTLFLHAREAGF